MRTEGIEASSAWQNHDEGVSPTPNKSESSSGESPHESEDEPLGSFATHICEMFGFAAAIAWLPFMLVAGAFVDPDFLALLPPSVQTAFGQLYILIPLCICLAICIVFGFATAALSDFIDSTHKIKYAWATGAAFALASFVLHGRLISVVTLAVSYSVIIILWRLCMVNKTLRAKAMISAAFACAVLLATCALLDSIAISFLPCALLCISYALFAPSMPEMGLNWHYVKRSEMLSRNMPWKRAFYSATTHLVSGVAYGILVFSYDSTIGLIIAGGAYLIAYAWANVYQRTNIVITRAQFRSFTSIAVMLLLVFVILVPDSWKGVLTLLAVGLIIADMLNNAIAQASQEKDETLSDIFYFGMRHGLNTLGTGIGFVGLYAIATLFGFNSTPIYVFLGCTAVLFAFAVQLSIGAYKGANDAPEQIEPDIMTVYVDPWHEKMARVAKAYELTDRQTEIFDALSRGRNAKYIMGRLYLSEGTVKKQCHQIYRKLGVHNQQDLITMVLETSLDEEADSKSRPDLMDQWAEQQRLAAERDAGVEKALRSAKTRSIDAASW